jgi:hypothetical protein
MPNDAATHAGFLHCQACLDERPEDSSPREYASLEVRLTPGGLRVWCKRHDMLVRDFRLHESETMTGLCACASCQGAVHLGPISDGPEVFPKVEAMHRSVWKHLGILQAALSSATAMSDAVHYMEGRWAANAILAAVTLLEAKMGKDPGGDEMANARGLAIGSAAIIYACEVVYPFAAGMLERLGLGDVVHEWKEANAEPPKVG